MKKIVLVLFSIISIFQSCSNKKKVTTSDLEKSHADTLLLRKSQSKDATDSSYLDNNTESYFRTTGDALSGILRILRYA